MDFKFRSMEERSSNFFSSSPNFPNPNLNNISFFTHQAIRAGFSSRDSRRQEFIQNPNPNPNRNFNPNNIRESIQRELEKERIRAEIIAEEAFRRRVLEEEVRRELMFEREMAMRRGERGFEFGGSTRRFDSPRVPLLANFEYRTGVSPNREVGFQGSQMTLPFQRDPVVAGNVEGNGSGSGSGSGNGFSLGVRLKEIKEIKGSALEVNKDKVIFLAKPNATDLKRKATTPPIGATVDPCAGLKKPKSKDEWSCALCRVTATSKRALDDHLLGKKHKARENGLNSQRTGFGTGPLPNMGSSSTGKPVKVPGASNKPSFRKKDENVGGESSSGKGDNALALPGTDIELTPSYDKQTSIEKKENTEVAIPQKSPACAKLNKKFRFFCEPCQVGAYSLKVIDAHKKGKRHLANVKELNITDKAASGETSVQKGTGQENSEESDMPCFVEKVVVEERKVLDVISVEEIKDEVKGEQVESNKESTNCDGAGFEEEKGEVHEIDGNDLVVAEKDDNSQVLPGSGE